MSDTCSPSVGWVASATSSGAESSDAATSATRAESIAGSVTSEVSTIDDLLMTITPSWLSHASTLTPTENPSRNPVDASIRLSFPAAVSAILNVATMPESVISCAISLPIGRVRSCSKRSLMFLLNLIESEAKIVGPAEVLPCSPHVTIWPEIVRDCESAAVSVIGTSIFIGLGPLPLGFVQRSSRRLC